MKKILLSLLLLFTLKASFGQLALNELYLEPNCGTEGTTQSDYFELYNGTGTPINLNCYRLAIVYKTGTGQNVETFVYVFDLPNRQIQPNGLFVFSGLSTFCYQGGSYTLDENINGVGTDNGYNWNSITAATSDASLKRYKLNPDCSPSPGNQPCWEIDQIYADATNIYDLLAQSKGSSGLYNIFLFNGTDAAENVLIFGYNSTTPPADITGLPSLTQPILGSGCTGTGLTFSTIVSNENVNSAAGADNGYFRSRNGICGTWLKANNSADHTPGSNNFSSNTSTSGSGTFAITPGIPVCTPGSTYSVEITVGNYTDSPYPIEYFIIENDFPYSTTRGLEDGDDVSDQVQTGSYANANGQNKFTVSGLLQGQSYFIIAVNAAGCFTTTQHIAGIECTVLPVNLKSFNATRTTSSNIAITWTTASEQNSKGFNVQKNVGGEWKTVGFVSSQATGGNSSSDLSYSFKDVNNEKGITQYRIQQVDLDGKAKYSDIRAVRGDNTVGKLIVYPNPSVDGKINVVFEDNTALRDVYVNDMQGRVIRSYRNISNNILVIEKLTSGFYTIKVTNRNTAASSVEKVVVK